MDLIYRVPAFLAPGTSFVETNIFKDWRWGVVLGSFKHITFIVHFISVILHQLHLRSAGVRSRRLGTPIYIS